MLSSLLLLFWKPLLAVLGIAAAVGVSWLKGRQSAAVAQQRAAANLQRRMQDAAANAPRTDAALDERLREHKF